MAPQLILKISKSPPAWSTKLASDCVTPEERKRPRYAIWSQSQPKACLQKNTEYQNFWRALLQDKIRLPHQIFSNWVFHFFEGKLEIQRGAEKAKKIMDMFQRLRSSENSEAIYTPFDFLLDASKELKTKMPLSREGRLIRHGKIILPIASLSEACRTIDTILESSMVLDETNPEGAGIEKLTYSLKTCHSKEEYLESIIAEWTGEAVELKFVNKSLESILSDILIDSTANTPICKIMRNEQENLDTVSCENLDIKISKNENAHFLTMNFNNTGEIRFETVAKIYEKERVKVISEIKVLANGEVKIDLKEDLSSSDESQNK